MKSKSLLWHQDRAEEAARKWAGELLGESLPPLVSLSTDDVRRKVAVLAEAAYLLYSVEWEASAYDVRGWEWPHAILREQASFNGHEPWAVLFRRAVELAAEPDPEDD